MTPILDLRMIAYARPKAEEVEENGGTDIEWLILEYGIPNSRLNVPIGQYPLGAFVLPVSVLFRLRGVGVQGEGSLARTALLFYC